MKLLTTSLCFDRRIYKTAFPDGIDKFATSSSTPIPSRQTSLLDVPTQSSASPTLLTSQSGAGRGNLFSRWGYSLSKPALRAATPTAMEPDGPVEEHIVAGAAFGKTIQIQHQGNAYLH